MQGVALKAVAAAALALTLASCAVVGAKGNDTGGIIPWSPESERTARQVAQESCGAYGKYAVISSMRRIPGDYITYTCVFDRRRG